MLVLSRREGERIIIRTPYGPDIVILIVDVARAKVRLGITAPDDCLIYREELMDYAAPRPEELK